MSGAKNCPETPRQKNDRYDVLGAHRHVGVERKY
jgi:hypothetical protein